MAEQGRQRTRFWDVFFRSAVFPPPVPCSAARIHCDQLSSLYGAFCLMPKLCNRFNRVRFCTEKSLFFSGFAAKLFAGAASRTLSSVNKKGSVGLVC
jgi:hypothetical protein